MYILYAVYVVRVLNFSDPWAVLGRFCHLVRYLYVGISPRRVNLFLNPYLNPCKWRFVFFSRFWEIGQDTYPHFHKFVSGTFRVCTCETNKKDEFSPANWFFTSDNENSPHICFIGHFLYFRRSILALKVVYLSANVIWYGTYFLL